MNDEDHQIPPIRMDQSMAVAANMVAGLIGAFGKPGDTEEELSTMHLICLTAFLYQLLSATKNKTEVATILEILVRDLRDAQ